MASVLGEGTSAGPLLGRMNELAVEISQAIRDCDTRRHAVARCERAVVELQLRDLYGPWSPREADQYARWMRDDIRMADTLADQLAKRNGDSAFAERLFLPYPQLQRPELRW